MFCCIVEYSMHASNYQLNQLIYKIFPKMSDDNVKPQSDNKTELSLHSSNDLNVNFLPQIYDIIRWYDLFISTFLSNIFKFFSLEKETQENATPKLVMLAREQPSDYSSKMSLLRGNFEKFRQQIVNVPGSNLSKEEQTQTLRSLRQQLIMKKELLLKYKNNSNFNMINH